MTLQYRKRTPRKKRIARNVGWPALAFEQNAMRFARQAREYIHRGKGIVPSFEHEGRVHEAEYTED